MADPQITPQPVDDGPHIDRACPNCGAGPGELCTTVTGQAMSDLTHRARPRPRRKPASRSRRPDSAVPRMTEAEVGKAVAKLAAKYSWKLNHHRRSRQGDRWETATTIAGWPDVVAFNPVRGGVLFAELKGTGGRVSPAQERVLADLRAAGARVFVWTPVEVADGSVEAVLSGGGGVG